MMQYPILIGDIGGTNSRFAIIEAEGVAGDPVLVGNDRYRDLESAISEEVLANAETAPKSMALALAGPINADSIQLTNADWTVRPRDLKAALGMDQAVFMNDFTAQGLASLMLGARDLKQIGGGKIDPQAPRVILGPGTGLGAGVAAWAGKWTILAGEGGHVDLGPRTERELQIWPYLNRRGNRMIAELAVSGPGLENLHQAILAADGAKGERLKASQITGGATAGDKTCREAVTLLTGFLARIAGDLALTVTARGGVYLGGGVARHIMEFLEAPAFRAEFENKTPFEDILRGIPIFVMTHPYPALAGMAGMVSEDRFELDSVVLRIL